MIKKKKKKIKEISNYYAFRRHPTLPFWNKKAFLSLSLSRSFFVQIKKFSIYLLPGLNILLNLNQKFSVHRADSWIWRKYWDEKSIKTEMGINFFFPFFLLLYLFRWQFWLPSRMMRMKKERNGKKEKETTLIETIFYIQRAGKI